MASPARDAAVRTAARQQQFLDVIDRDEATRRFQKHLRLESLGCETVPLVAALGRVLAVDVVADVDVPGFDRSNMDGFAVRAVDTFDAMEERPRRVTLNNEVLSPGVESHISLRPGTATAIATGGILPRGADAVVMIESTHLIESERESTERGESVLEIYRAVAAAENVMFAGADIAKGETVLRAGQMLSSREIGVLAAIGRTEIDVCRRPRVAIISTGDEIVAPGEPRPAGAVYDSNAAILTASVTELGGEPIPLGIVSDDERKLEQILDQAMKCDVVVLSGGTSKGAGDLSYRVVSRRLQNPGIVAHGVALKPGKPICLAVSDGKPVVILPGFPTSAIFTFGEFVAPVIRALAGRPRERRKTVSAVLPVRVHSDRGRTEYLLVGLIHRDGLPAAYPMGKGSGSVTTFSCADGFITIDQQTELIESGSVVDVALLSDRLEPADLVVIGSHCIGLDFLLGKLHEQGFTSKVMFVGSQGGLAAAKRGECDLAGVHLMDPETGKYNQSFLTESLRLLPGYQRMQALVYRPGDRRFQGRTLPEAIEAALNDPDCRMINRNTGSGTRILIDRLLDGHRPPGYAIQPKSHNAVATAVQGGRGDWGIALKTVADTYGLASLPVQQEEYDFLVPQERWDRPAIRAFRELLADANIRRQLDEMGFSAAETVFDGR